MKKAFFNFTLTVFFVFCLAALGCKTTPPAEEPKNDIWALLSSGDESAKDFFLGEFSVNETDPAGKTPLHYAVENNNTMLTAFFISLGANTNVLDLENRSPLGISIENGNAKITELLVNAGADIHLPINDNTTAAKIALSKNSAALRSILTPSTIESVDSEGRTILHLSAIEGKIRAVIDILAKSPADGALINKKDNYQKQAIDYAFSKTDSRNHIEVAEQLILQGAVSENPVFAYFAPAVRTGNYNIRRSDGFAPIHFAARDGHFGMLQFLFEKEADINIKSTSGSSPLHEAARSGNIQVMSLLLNRGADVNSIDANGNTPLHIGIPANVHREALTLLLGKGGNPSLRDEHGDTPLHIVIILNRPIDVIQTLLNGNTEVVHIRNIQGKTPLYIAIQEKRVDLIPLLLSYGSEVFAADNSGVTPFSLALQNNGGMFDLLVTPESVIQRDSAGNTMLHEAVRNRGIPRHIGIILDAKAFVDARNMEGDTALHFAVRMNERENGEFLISRGASIFSLNAASQSPLYLALTYSGGIIQWLLNPTTIIAKDGLGNNMLHYASQWNLNTAIPVIIQKGVSVEEKNATGETPLFMSVRTNSPSTMRTLLENNAGLNTTDNQGNTLLHTAVRWNALDAASLLIMSGIDINAHSLTGETALHNAVVLEMPEIETMLIREKANLEARDNQGNTPFMLAVKNGLTSSIEKLIAAGADPNARNIMGDTSLHLAVATENYDLVNTLLRVGTSSIHARNTKGRTPFQNSISVSTRMVISLLSNGRVNISDDTGRSALHIAVQERASPEIIRTIINQGARINAVDSNGYTPLRTAVDLGLLETIKILSDTGADPFIAASDNKTPADLALANSLKSGDDYIRAVFSGRAINTRDNSANTILHLAARSGSPQIITTLIELGANKSLRNISSETPFDIARRWNRTENIELLRN